jgi:1-deoxy-D-xylulose-5-phosphate reductoisomerase
MKNLLILGASGSIGQQCLDIVRDNKNDFRVVGISIGTNIVILKNILKEFKDIKYVYMIRQEDAIAFKKEYPNIIFITEKNGLVNLVNLSNADMVVNALVGFVGLKPTITALKKNLIVCLANKESLVVGGEIINGLLAEGYGKLYPIDSEHVALSKCLNKVNKEDVSKLIITASGGAFRDLSRDQLKDVTYKDALKHPTWTMGAKITIDCATMMNKGFEIIEAYYLFGFPIDDIEVLLHDESIIHSMLLLKDGTYVADIGKPDMHNPIRYALYEENIDYKIYKESDYHKFGPYHFRSYDPNRYPCVEMAKMAIRAGGIMPAVLNASNEIAVQAFLNSQIAFLEIEKIVFHSLQHFTNILHPSIEQIDEADKETRKYVLNLIKDNKLWRF